jgi:hypothetical protein
MTTGKAMRIDLRRVDVETGSVLKAASSKAGSGDIAGWLAAARSAAAELYGGE